MSLKKINPQYFDFQNFCIILLTLHTLSSSIILYYMWFLKLHYVFFDVFMLRFELTLVTVLHKLLWKEEYYEKIGKVVILCK